MRMIKVNYLLLIILVWMQYSLWFCKNGVLDFIRIYNDTKLYKSINNIDKIKMRNNQLLLDIHDLNYEYKLIEEYARYDLGMIKINEVFYYIKFEN